MACHLCAFGGLSYVAQPIAVANPTSDGTGTCENCFSLACPAHGRKGAGAARYLCADCIATQYLVAGISGGGGSGSGPGGNAPSGTSGTDDDPPDDTDGGGAAPVADTTESSRIVSELWGLAPLILALADGLGGGRFDEVLRFVATDISQTAGQTALLGRGLAFRVQRTLDEADAEAIAVMLGLSVPELDQDAAREVLLAMAQARATELAREIVDVAETILQAGGPNIYGGVDARDAFAATLAARGQDPRDDIAVTRLRGALHLPALALQLLFALVDGDGLGPSLEQGRAGPYPSPATPAKMALARALAY